MSQWTEFRDSTMVPFLLKYKWQIIAIVALVSFGAWLGHNL